MSTLFAECAVVPVFDEHLALNLDVHAGQYRFDDVAREPVTTALNAHGVTDHEWVDATHLSITSDNPTTIIPVTMIASGFAPTSNAATIKPISKRPLTTIPRRASSSRSLRSACRSRPAVRSLRSHRR